MLTLEATEFEITDGTEWVRLNRPKARNSLSAALVNEVYQHLQAANDNLDVRCIVITGKGPAFCAGADLKNPPGQVVDGQSQAIAYPDVLSSIMDSPKPVIAAINGAAFA